MGRALICAGALLGLIGVAAGAFGAHAIRSRVTSERLDNWKTAADYELWHALATIASGLIAVRWASGAAAVAGWCFVAGVLLFCGSLYALALTDRRRWGAVTPFGGVLFLAGWAFLIVAAIRG
ncbi:MAG TPA: DUF423 domain-containing protein [Actinomycetota bacterium]|nr:DUF423 domain-containing protein [Actinomycetota bacterium]